MAESASDTGKPAAAPRPRRSGVVVPNEASWSQRLMAGVLVLAIRLVVRTFRYRWNDPHGLLERPPDGPVIFCIWHNRIALCMEAYRVFARESNRKGMATMASASRDGGFIAAVLEKFGVVPIRGSSSRRGPQALLELVTWAERGRDIALTPDGPRGPRYQVQDGLIAIAQVTGLPIVPFSFHARRKIELKSWDRFQVPLPFSRVEMNIGEAIRVPRELTEEQRVAVRQQVEASLRALSVD